MDLLLGFPLHLLCFLLNGPGFISGFLPEGEYTSQVRMFCHIDKQEVDVPIFDRFLNSNCQMQSIQC